MIFYLATLRGTQIMDRFLRSWAGQLKKRLVTVPYSHLSRLMPLPPGPVIFTDLEILTASELECVRRQSESLKKEDPDRRILNDPARVLTRYALLRRLHDEEINAFSVTRLNSREPHGFPVFLRRESDHGGSLTPLLHSEEELEVALTRLKNRAVPTDDILIVDYCHTADSKGLFRKYSAFRIGDEIFGRDLMFGRDWMLKRRAELVGAAMLTEERAFLERNPHEAELRKIFELAKIEYGRMDYGLKEGKLQVWEINTNPWIVKEPWQFPPLRLPNLETSVKRALQALENLDDRQVPSEADAWRRKRALVCLPQVGPLVARTRLKLFVKRNLRQLGRAWGRWRHRVTSR